MTKWEYKQEHGYSPMKEASMNALGKEGWELVDVVVVRETFGYATVHIFKRPIIEVSK